MMEVGIVKRNAKKGMKFNTGNLVYTEIPRTDSIFTDIHKSPCVIVCATESNQGTLILTYLDKVSLLKS